MDIVNLIALIKKIINYSLKCACGDVCNRVLKTDINMFVRCAVTESLCALILQALTDTVAAFDFFKLNIL
jgi:hypothetical protein